MILLFDGKVDRCLTARIYYVQVEYLPRVRFVKLHAVSQRVYLTLAHGNVQRRSLERVDVVEVQLVYLEALKEDLTSQLHILIVLYKQQVYYVGTDLAFHG